MLTEEAKNGFYNRVADQLTTRESREDHLAELKPIMVELNIQLEGINLQKKLFSKNPKKLQVTYEYELDPEWIEYAYKRSMDEIDKEIMKITDTLEYTNFKIDYLTKILSEE